MKPDLASHNLITQFAQSPGVLNHNSDHLLQTDQRQTLIPSLPKHLKQQKNNLHPQPCSPDGGHKNTETENPLPSTGISHGLLAEQNYIELQVDLYLSAAKEDNGMTVKGLQQLAKSIGVSKPERFTSELALIRLIQSASHHRPCFKSKPNEICDDPTPCQWRTECQKLVAEWQR